MASQLLTCAVRVRAKVSKRKCGDTVSKSRRVLFSFSALVIILITGTFIAPESSSCSEFKKDILTPDSNTDEIDQQALVEKAQGAVRSQFYENLGQINNADVRFYGNIPGGTIGFGESWVLLWMEGAESSIVLSFDGAAAVVPQGIDQVSHHTNYFLGDRGTFIGIGGFTGVVYNDLWSGISLFYRATADGAKYEFRVAPGADPADIRVRCKDADSIVIAKTSLRIDNGDGTLVDEGLRVFQGATYVEGEFISLGHHVFGFRVDEYDISKPLVIDPLLYSTYVGGNSYDWATSIAIDASGNAYVTGHTTSSNFPTVNAYDSSLGGGRDAFVFKLNAAGNGLLYSTYVGGSGADEGHSIAIDTSGNAYVTGETWSTDFPTVNAYDSSLGGTYDVFVFKLSEVPGAINTGTATYDNLFPMIVVATVGGLGLISLMAVFIVLKRRPGDREPEGPLVSREHTEKPTRPLVLAKPIDTSLSEDYEPSETVSTSPPPGVPEEGVHVFRGCTAVGGRFEYKVKVRNETSSVITNVTVTILSYPDDCMEISGSTVKTIKRIGPGEFRSPQFIFVPTKDCVQGRIIATVSYIDHHDEPHTLQAEPYMIRSVCDLLEPLVSTMQQFELILGDLEHTSEEHALPWNPEVLFSKVKAFLPSRNFHIVGASGDTIGGVFTGTIRGLAEGKYTGKKVAVRILISGPAEANEARVVVEGLGEDIAMLPTTIEEIARGIESWTCMNCGAALEPDEVNQIKAGAPVRCRYCGHTMTIDLYRK